MGWKFLEKPKTMLASKLLVREFMDMEPAPHDRPLSERRLMVYERILRAGEFRPVTWASALCHETNSVYRVNGKHTATLLSKQEPIPEFHITIERYQCDTLNDVASLYNTFDSNLASRSTRDINAAFAATIPALRDFSPKLIDLTVIAATFHKWDETTRNKVPPAERAEELLDNQDFTVWLRGVLNTLTFAKSSPCKPLIRGPVVSAMMATYRRRPQLATEFWCMVRDESAPDRNDASRALARFLVRSSIANSKGETGKDKVVVGQKEMYAKCIHAWNAWRKDEKRDTLSWKASAPLPEPTK